MFKQTWDSHTTEHYLATGTIIHTTFLDLKEIMLCKGKKRSILQGYMAYDSF